MSVLIETSSFNAPPPGSISRLFASRNCMPSACSIPVPASFVALPPIPIIIFLQLLFKACLINSPVPYDVVFHGFLSLSFSSSIPDADAISITAVSPSPSTPKCAVISRISGSWTFLWKIFPFVAVTSVTTVPSPPSARGTNFILASGKTFLIPSSMNLATSGDVRQSLNESGAISIFIIIHYIFWLNLLIFQPDTFFHSS